MMINLSKSWGGGEKWFLTVGEALQARGFQVLMVCYPGSALKSRLDKTSLEHVEMGIRFSSFLNPWKVLGMWRLIRKSQPDMIMMNASHELKTFGLMGAVAGVKHIIFRRGVSYAITRNFFNNWYMRRIVTAFLANSHATFTAVTSSFPELLKKKYLRLNNGIQVASWRSYPEKKNPLFIGMSARLDDVKGIDRAIHAMEHIKDQVPEARLHIFGEGPHGEKLREMSRALGLKEKIIFHGFVNDVQEALSTCSIFLFTPRLGEGTSIALIEAMSMEMPCVVFDTPAMAEVVVEGETGFVVKDGDIVGLAARLAQLLRDEELCAKMGIAGRKRAEKLFNLPTSVIDPLETWLRGMLETGND